MVFVTVGTHEQQFNRLIEYIDNAKSAGEITEDVIMQTGFSTYEPKYCKWEKLIPYRDMLNNVRNANIVITHGGPSSFMMPLQIGKIPIVVPREFKFGEHVNDHQVEFVRAVAERQGNIIPIYDIGTLSGVIQNYKTVVASMPNELISNNARFNKDFERIVEGIALK